MVHFAKDKVAIHITRCLLSGRENKKSCCCVHYFFVSTARDVPWTIEGKEQRVRQLAQTLLKSGTHTMTRKNFQTLAVHDTQKCKAALC